MYGIEISAGTQRWALTIVAAGSLLMSSCATSVTPSTTTIAPAAPTSVATEVVPDVPTAAPAEAAASCEVTPQVARLDQVIDFAAGTSGTTLAGTLEPRSLHSYSLDASAGQTMTVTVTGGAVVDVFGPAGSMMQTGSNVTVSPLPTTGTYVLDVYSESCAALSYDLLVDIPVSGASGGNACPGYTQFTTADGQDWPMRRCQQGQLVRDVQEALKNEGFDVDVDGFFGPGTAIAVGQWRGDGVGELIPSDLEALFPFHDDVVVPESEAMSPPSIQSNFVNLVAGTDYIERAELRTGDRLQIQVLDSGDGTDPTITLIDPFGAGVAFDDDSGETPLGARIDVVVESTGLFQIVVSSINGISGNVEVGMIVN
ncbi:MAG: hypothetical protein ACJAR2_001102 [Ilumatobacter sp.]|jgi:hypothetical protein